MASDLKRMRLWKFSKVEENFDQKRRHSESTKNVIKLKTQELLVIM